MRIAVFARRLRGPSWSCGGGDRRGNGEKNCSREVRLRVCYAQADICFIVSSLGIPGDDLVHECIIIFQEPTLRSPEPRWSWDVVNVATRCFTMESPKRKIARVVRMCAWRQECRNSMRIKKRRQNAGSLLAYVYSDLQSRYS